MKQQLRPIVLVIDDEAELQQAVISTLPEELRSCCVVRGPEDVTEADLKNAHLVLVDYKLDAWTGNSPKANVCKHIPNGLALAAVLQQQVTEKDNPHAVAFAIHSGHLPELTHPFKPEPRIHLLSRICNIDWAFEKQSADGPTNTFRRIRCLAEAVYLLPVEWPQSDAVKKRAEAMRLLALDGRIPWTEQAWSNVERASPPLDELIQRIHGLLFLRWMLQRILSYPCFLLDDHWLAARLGATPESVKRALAGDLSALLSPSLYRGILADFRGPRWWRIGVEYILWELAGKQSLGTERMRHMLIEGRKIPLVRTRSPQPVVCLDTDFLPLEDLHDPKDAVRIQPDDWPTFAEPAWTTISVAEADERMRGLVIEADRGRLGTQTEDGE